MRRLEKENPWIEHDKQFFGAPGGAYDFEAKQAHLAGQRVAQLQDRRDKLARGLNARAHTLLGKEEEQVRARRGRGTRIIRPSRSLLATINARAAASRSL